MLAKFKNSFVYSEIFIPFKRTEYLESIKKNRKITPDVNLKIETQHYTVETPQNYEVTFPCFHGHYSKQQDSFLFYTPLGSHIQVKNAFALDCTNLYT